MENFITLTISSGTREVEVLLRSTEWHGRLLGVRIRKETAHSFAFGERESAPTATIYYYRPIMALLKVNILNR